MAEENYMSSEINHNTPPFVPEYDLGQGGGGPDYKDLQNRIRRENEPNELRNLVEQRRNFLRDLQDAGAVDLRSVKVRIQDTLNNSDKTNAQANLSDLIDQFNREDEQDDVDQQYRVSGIVAAGVRRFGNLALDPQGRDMGVLHAKEIALNIPANQIIEAFTREPTVQAQATQGPFGGQMDARAFGQALGKEIMGEKLTSRAKYNEFLQIEEWANSDPQPPNPSAPESYYVMMTPKEREEFKSRHELLKLARYKRGRMIPPPSLDSLSKTEWGDFSKTETQMLYELPGVRNAMEIYVRLLKSDEQVVNGTSLREAKLREGDLGDYRRYIRGQIEQQVIDGWRTRHDELVASGDQEGVQKYVQRSMDNLAGDPEELETRARDAEQVAFNLLYAGNVFESLDSQWDNDHRIRRPKISSDLVHPVIKDQMCPLDALISSLKKESSSTSWVGKFGEWAYETSQRRNRNGEITGDENIQIIDDLHSTKYWLKDGDTLNVPECYPIQLIGSFWEETTIKGSKGEQNLLDYLEAGRPIEWDKIDNQGIWGAYSSKLMKAGALWDTFKGSQSLKADTKSIEEWKTNIDNALGKFGKRDETSIKRWLIYASVGVKPLKDKPELAIPAFRRSIRANLGQKKLNYLRWDELLFPWDQPM